MNWLYWLIPMKVINTSAFLFITTGSMYLMKFCKEFENKIISLIDRTVASMSSFENDDLYVEILQHLNACRGYVENFQGRKDVIESIKQYVLSSSTSKCRTDVEWSFEVGSTSYSPVALHMIAKWFTLVRVLFILQRRFIFCLIQHCW